MKILAISAHHPPYHFGGYEIRVKNILDGLAARGHTLCVLTNHPEKGGREKDGEQPYPIIRKLHNRRYARFFPKEILFDLLDTRLLQRQIEQFAPDVIYLGHTYMLSKALLPYLARQSIPIVYDEGGIGLIEAWQEHGRWFRFTGDYRSKFAFLNWIKPLVIWLVCAFSRGRIHRGWTWPQNIRIIFNSRLNHANARAAGVPIDNSTVIHSGIDTSIFRFQPREKLGTPLCIITPGRIERRKGQLDAVYLVKALIDDGIDTRLVLAGAGWPDGYYDEVIAAIKEKQLSDHVTVLPMQSTQELAAQYHKADICLFPSYQQIGFSRVPLEAMACGCLVISYGNEGSDEVLTDRENGFIVKPMDIRGSIRIIDELLDNPFVVNSIISNAKDLIKNEYAMPIYVESITKNITSYIAKR